MLQDILCYNNKVKSINPVLNNAEMHYARSTIQIDELNYLGMLDSKQSFIKIKNRDHCTPWSAGQTLSLQEPSLLLPATPMSISIYFTNLLNILLNILKVNLCKHSYNAQHHQCMVIYGNNNCRGWSHKPMRT